MDFFNNPNTNTFLDSKYVNPDYLFAKGSAFAKDVFYFIFVSDTFKVILSLFAIFFLTMIFYTIVRMFEIRKKEHNHLHHEIAEYAHHMAEKEKQKKESGVSKNERWNAVLNHLFSENKGDWKLAIIEADSMLEALMEQLGFEGTSLGEKLKSADRDTFPNLTLAWEVHTIRNRIAHEGIAYEISTHEAKRVIAIYEHIFHDFGFI